MMNAIICNRPGELKSISKESPVRRKGHAILKIRRVGICGTDIHAFDGTQPYFSYPRILGHELAAELVEADGVDGIDTGEAVTIIPYLSCEECIACRTGKPNCCVRMNVCGVHIDGGMVEYLSVPGSALVRGNGLTVDELAMVEPLAIGAHSVRRADVKPGEFVLVIGAGPIGMGIMTFSRLQGATVIAMDVDERRLEFCRTRIHVDHAVNPLNSDAMERIRSITRNDMPTAMFDATGNQQAINTALDYLAHGGRYVLVGLQKGDISFSHPEFHKRETTLMSSRNALRSDFEYVISCINRKMVLPETLITHRLPFGSVPAEFGKLLTSGGLIVKAIIDIT
jgi:2-desacetyl-2-hydroxyethyl bacteriochlorophyllide A dehydrogenase